MRRRSLPASYWDGPLVTCVPCRGRGWIIQEDATGMPGHEVTCPYCKGKGTTWWVRGRRLRRLNWRTRYRRWAIYAAALGLAMTGHLWPPLDDYTAFSSYMFVLHLALWLIIIVAWCLTPSRRSQLRKARHAPGFDTPREGKWLTGFGVAVGLRSLWDSHEKRGF